MKIAIIGAGITGLTSGYQLSKRGHQVVIFEKEGFAGGLAASFKKKNWDWPLEFYFHHLFTTDNEVKNLIEDLGLEKKLYYLRPKTSIFKKGKIYQFDSPLSVLKFPLLSFPNRLRTGLVTLSLKTNPRWQELEKVKATDWLKQRYGQRAYQILWQPLLKSKFGDQAEKISMAWFWARIKKRSSRLGYLEGGFQTLVEKLEKEIKNRSGKIYFNHEVKNLNEVKGFNKVIISTPANKFFPEIKLPKMLGAISLILEIKKKFLSDNTYWLNINEEDFPFVAVVEHTNFIDAKHYSDNHLVYVGGYYPQNHPFFKMDKKKLFKEWLPHLRKINPNFDFRLSIIHLSLFTNLNAQPVVPINYSRLIPPHQTPLKNVFLANMQQVYPWDRGINYAISLSNKVTKLVLNE